MKHFPNSWNASVRITLIDHCFCCWFFIRLFFLLVFASNAIYLYCLQSFDALSVGGEIIRIKTKRVYRLSPKSLFYLCYLIILKADILFRSFLSFCFYFIWTFVFFLSNSHVEWMLSFYIWYVYIYFKWSLAAIFMTMITKCVRYLYSHAQSFSLA